MEYANLNMFDSLTSRMFTCEMCISTSNCFVWQLLTFQYFGHFSLSRESNTLCYLFSAETFLWGELRTRHENSILFKVIIINTHSHYNNNTPCKISRNLRKLAIQYHWFFCLYNPHMLWRLWFVSTLNAWKSNSC